jgi:hypothetical protein
LAKRVSALERASVVVVVEGAVLVEEEGATETVVVDSTVVERVVAASVDVVLSLVPGVVTVAVEEVT